MAQENYGLYGKMSLDETEDIPLRKGIIRFPSTPEEAPNLIASRCKVCGDISFPPKLLCGKCEGGDMEEYLLNNRATVYSYTVIYQGGLPGVDIPYALVIVKFSDDDELLIAGQMTGTDPEDVKIGMEVETVIDTVRLGLMGLLSGRIRSVLGYKFRPVKNS